MDDPLPAAGWLAVFGGTLLSPLVLGKLVVGIARSRTAKKVLRNVLGADDSGGADLPTRAAERITFLESEVSKQTRAAHAWHVHALKTEHERDSLRGALAEETRQHMAADARAEAMRAELAAIRAQFQTGRVVVPPAQPQGAAHGPGLVRSSSHGGGPRPGRLPDVAHPDRRGAPEKGGGNPR